MSGLQQSSSSFFLTAETIASSLLDVYHPTLRRDLLEDFRERLLLEEDPTERRLFLQQLQNITCSSKHAVKRIALLLIDIITGLENNHDDDDVDLALSTLLHVLLQSKNNIDDAKSLMKTVIQGFSNIGPEQRSRWSQSFLKLAQTTSMELVPVAVPLSAALLIADPATTNQQQTVLYWELLLKYTSTIDKVDPQKLLLASTFFDQQQQQQDTTLTTTTWNTVISPSLLQKFKAQPEKTLQILPFWLQAGGSPTDEWAQLLVQHPAAHDCIHVWCQHSPSAAVPVFTHALLHSTTTTLLPVRQAIYETMKKIAAAATTTTQQQDGALVNRVLEGLVQMALKETKSEPRLLATAAMLQWWSLSTSTAPSSLIDFMRECLKKEKGNLLTLVLEQLSRENMQAWLNMIYNKNDTEETLLSLADGKRTMDAFLGVYMLLEYAKLSTSKTIPKAILKHLSKGTSFLYKAEVGHPSGSFLPRILALYLEMSNDKLPDVAYEAIAKSIALPSKLGELRIVDDMLKSLKLILDSDDKAAACIIDALLSTVNSISLRFEALSEERTATRAAREAEPDPNVVVPRFDGHSVRRSAILLLDYSVELKYFARGLLLMHAGSSLKVDGHQRAALLVNTRSALQSNTALYELDDDSLKGFAEDLLLVVASEGSDDGSYDGDQVQNAGLSLLVTLGQLGANFDPDVDEVDDMMNQEKVFNFTNRLCVSGISPLLANTLSCSLKAVSCLTEKDIAIYLSERGTLYGAENEQAPGSAIGANASRRTEDQEWEIQIRKEMLERKKASTGKDKVLSEGELKTVKEQDLIRERIKFIHKKFLRVLGSIRYLCISDIETGNRCLPTLALPVLVASIPMISDLPFVGDLRSLSQSTLEALCGSVFEIHEAHAPTLAKALVLSCTVAQNTDAEISTPKIEPISLPTACAAAACAIHEMDTFGDTLSPPSFFLLFPILQAALKGPRTPTGCDGALRVLSRHLTLLSDNGRQSFLSNLRPDILSTVLELLRHDRAQTFHSPSPFDVVCNCFDTGIPEPKTSDLLPLLDERGALGTVGCRKASVMVLNVILDFHPGILQKNPLVESRIWVGCFDDDEDVKTHAVKAWIKLKGNCQDNALLFPPSPSFSLALLPLLGHSNAAIAASSALAYANAISLHPDATKRNLEKLFKTYIDSFPAIISDFSQEPSVIDDRSKNQAPEKKPLSLGLPKKKSVAKKSALDVAGIGRPKVGKGKKKLPTLSSDILKPKKERTMDKETLESQFIGFKKDPDRKIDSPQKMMVRKGVLSVLRCMNLTKPSFQLDESSLKQVTLFLTAFGMADVNEELQSLARDTLRDTIASNGGSESTIEYLLALLENVLHTGNINVDELQEMEPNKVPTDVASTDFRKQGAVVALGSIALHLKGSENESKVDSTVNMLVSALETPSEDVQTSVADALTKLMKKGRTMDRVPSLVETFINGCFHGKTLALRRGSAYGLAATVKGGGIGTLKKLDVIQQLDEACSSGDARAKEGSLFAMELLSDRLGLLFEPYVINLLPSLLRSFSDGNDHVRNAATNTAALIMSKLSAHGVKLVLPAVLASFNDAAWRTKQASISMLGSMSHLAPKQLASALPKVVPKLIEAFSDTHPKVKQSAEDALKEIGKVVKNPEISSLSPTLLKALTNPSEYTSRALESLIETEFLHSIDSPSLALIVPILHRGLRDRWATNKRCGALIAGNICTMINDPSDFSPYLPTILPDLQVSLLDPIPDVRNSSAKALGSLVRSLGNSVTNELRPWLSMKLRDSSCSSAERSGAAQGLTEVLIASGSSAIEDVMHEEIFPLQDHPDPCTREGILWMLTFLPQAMGQNFSTLLNASLPVLITGLSDDSETVRDVAMRAGRVMIKSHGKVHVDTILPYLEKGLIHDDHRIRMSSLSLLGDLLSMIGGTQVHKSEGDTQDDFRRAEKAQAQISLVLGPETRRRIYSELFLARNDAAHSVRSSAVQVWKTIVSVTARTLRDILPVLVDRIVSSLASGQQERILVAGKTLGDLVSKLGDSVFPQIIPVLRSSLYEGDRDTKRGVCVGMNEILKCSTKDQIAKYLSVLVKLVQDALSDEDPEVRSLASESFQSLHELVGNKATEEIIPSLMVALEAEDSESVARSINGLSAILSVKSRDLLPYIIPRLIASPITEIHAVALSRIAEVTGSSLNLHFGRIVTSLLNDLSDFDPSIEGGRHGALQQCVSSICESLEAPGVPVLISEVASKCASDKVGIRRESCRFFEKIIIYRSSHQDFYEQIPVIIRELIYRLNDNDMEVLQACNGAFTALSAHVPAEELVKNVEFMRNSIASLVSDARRRKGGVGDGLFLLPGFNMPKGLDPLLPIYQRGILYGSPSIREVSAAGLGEVLSITSSKYLAGPVIIKMTGPLLRIVGDRNPSEVKIAILKTLGLILEKGGASLRAFVPQFQTTFVKAFSDPSRQVRLEAIHALGLLMPLSTRIDPLVKDLVTGSQLENIPAEGDAAVAIQTATLLGLAVVVRQAGHKAKLPGSISSAIELSSRLTGQQDAGVREAAAKVLGNSCAVAGHEEASKILKAILEDPDPDEQVRHGNACVIRWLFSASNVVQDSVLHSKVRELLTRYLSDDVPMVREAACIAIGPVIARSPDATQSMLLTEGGIIKILKNSKESLEIHKAVAKGLCLALNIIEPPQRISFLGNTLEYCMKLALSGTQRVQFAYNYVLWLALDVQHGDAGLEEFSAKAHFEAARSMRSLQEKVLKRITSVPFLDD